ncbi:RICIN domain-containing protein [Mycobacterium simulans]|uniref:hypothetical protein n=1 Tax=Mycobacterium simulans TaxID=627089 RepID=UPI00163FE28F|nr:hypothetical protein [Mycobacterium simulans]
MTPIRRAIRLFIPLVPANTEREQEGYVSTKSIDAAQRSSHIPRRRFIVPANVDENPSRYDRAPDAVQRLDIRYAPAGEADAHPIAMLADEISAVPWIVTP